jgi:hypothetical protein
MMLAGCTQTKQKREGQYPRKPRTRNLKKRTENQRKNQTGKRGRGIEKRQKTKKNIKSMMFLQTKEGFKSSALRITKSRKESC